jgi:NAD(P)-dependent dehydrogenase (short-subunit alcohol dehydrogenase family)
VAKSDSGGPLSGKVAVVTGGGGVLCGEMARALGSDGAKVAVLDLREGAAQAVAEAIKSSGGEAVGLACDVLDRASLDAARAKVREALGAVSFLVNGAGGNKKEATTGPELPFFDIPAEAARFVMDLNFLGTFLPCQVFGRDLADRCEGVVVNIASMNAVRPLTKIPAYSAAKAAVANFTQWLAVHMCQCYSKTIRVNAIAPGFFLTEQNRFLLQDDKGEPTPRGKQIVEHTPMGRFGEPRELIGALRWLLSDGARFVTGIVLPVDGGFSAYSGV